MEKYKGVIFDLDGTMVDNMMVHHKAWQRKLKSMGLDFTLEQVREQIHDVNEEILKRLFGDRFTAAERSQHAADKEAEYRSIYKPELIKGLPALLASLKSQDIPMGIGSAAPRENVDFVLDHLAVRDYFKVVLHAGDVVKGKPDPEIYVKAAEKLNVPVDQCVIFEDSPTGAEAASRAGSAVIIVTTSHSENEFARFPNVVKFIKDYDEITSELI